MAADQVVRSSRAFDSIEERVETIAESLGLQGVDVTVRQLDESVVESSVVLDFSLNSPTLGLFGNDTVSSSCYSYRGENEMHSTYISKNRAGAVLPIMVVLIVMLLSIAAITINSNWLLYHRINSQTTADLAAISTLVKVQTDTDEHSRINTAKGLGTSIYDGISYSLEALDDPNATRHVILLSDGQPLPTGGTSINEPPLPRQPGRPNTRVAARNASTENVTIHTISFSGNSLTASRGSLADPIHESPQEMRAENVTIHTISFSGNFSALREVAEETGGENFTAYSQEELQQAFTELLGAFRVQLTD